MLGVSAVQRMWSTEGECVSAQRPPCNTVTTAAVATRGVCAAHTYAGPVVEGDILPNTWAMSLLCAQCYIAGAHGSRP
jgi:hypothetical protein